MGLGTDRSKDYRRISPVTHKRENDCRTRDDFLGEQGLAEMTTWPDEQRSNPQPFWQKDANSWHYVTLQAGQQPSEPVSPAEGDALTALKRFAATVRDPAA